MKSKKFAVVIILLVIGVVLSLFGYFNDGEVDTKDITESSITPSPITTNFGTSLPTGFPTNFPVYPNSQITSSYSTKSSNKIGMSVSWEVKTGSKNVIDYFTTELTDKGWSVDVSENTPNIINFTQDQVKGFVIIADDGGAVSITAALSLQ